MFNSEHNLEIFASLVAHASHVSCDRQCLIIPCVRDQGCQVVMNNAGFGVKQRDVNCGSAAF